MPVVRIVPTQVHTNDPVAAICGRHRHLLAELVTLLSLTFTDAHHIRFVQTGQLPAVRLLLSVKAFAKRQQLTQSTLRLSHFATRVAENPAEPRPEFLQSVSHSLELFRVGITTPHGGRFLYHAAVRLTQLDEPSDTASNLSDA